MVTMPSEPIVVGQVRRLPYTKRHMRVAWVDHALGKALVFAKTSPEDWYQWEPIENVERWSLVGGGDG